MTNISIGTRGSPLALTQAHIVADALHAQTPLEMTVVPLMTSGDAMQEASLADFGGKGLFTKEIDRALLDGRVDLAVHSMKDMPTIMPDGIQIAAVLPREDARDAFISLKYPSIDALPQGAKFGTSGLRRAAQVKHLRPDLEIVPFRGNVETRLKKLSDGVADATMLAVAGMKRGGHLSKATQILDEDVLLPAVAQGALAVTCRAEDVKMQALIAALNDQTAAAETLCERAFLKEMNGSCRMPLAGLARVSGGHLTFKGMYLSEDGAQLYDASAEGDMADAAKVGCYVAADIRRQMEKRA